jgi:5-oxoprolinase (ATP-hydrolysing)
MSGFRFSIDRGGTFTDIYAELPNGEGFKVIKLLSEDPLNYDDAPREGIRRVLADYYQDDLTEQTVDAKNIEWIRMGTTIATNALLERKGAPTALLITAGFGDLLQIGDQSRPDLFDLKVSKPELIYSKVVEVEERLRIMHPEDVELNLEQLVGVNGERFVVLKKPNLALLRPHMQQLLVEGIDSLAVVFMHSYACPQHEQMVGELAREMGFKQISLSSEVMPMVKIVSRGDTTSVDSYLTPHIKSYLESFRGGFGGTLQDSQLLFMQSDGGLASAQEFSGSRAILSGPAGGVVGYAVTTYKSKPVIGFDMGGTSTDVSRFGGEYDLAFESETAGVRIQAPQLDIKTVAAGGGSRLFFDNGMFVVGPESAGAHPGPICYRKGGYLTVTDANLILGRVQADYFPNIFGESEDLPLDYAASYRAMESLTAEINLYYEASSRSEMSVESVALGFIEVANEVMARPIREVSVMRGFNIKEHTLASFGGAGGQHSCAIARTLGISSIFIHRFSGILSAYGIGLADIVVERQQPAAEVIDKDGEPSVQNSITHNFKKLEQEGVAELVAQGVKKSAIATYRYLNLRYEGTDTALMVEQPSDLNFAYAFRELYLREFGFELKERAILVDDIRVRAVGSVDTLRSFPLEHTLSAGKVNLQDDRESVQIYFYGGWRDTTLYKVEDIQADTKIAGPLLLIQQSGTILVEPGCSVSVSSDGDLEIEIARDDIQRVSDEVDPIQLSIFSNLFISIAEQMGRVLQKSAISTNIKERLDFSCALFDAHGNLVANAPHVPVHLGAMSEAIKEQIRLVEKINPGDVLVSNHPAAGGSHLPDITVMTPLFYSGKIVFWLANRGHHADVGGVSPGSMPPWSKTLADEGVAILSCKIVEGALFQEEKISRKLMAEGSDKPGTRLLSDNISDLRAQVAANNRGTELMLEMVAQYGVSVVQAYMGYLHQRAEDAVRSSLRKLSIDRGMSMRDSVKATDYLDDGSPIILTLTIDRKDGSAIFDFSGTGGELKGNLNAPRAVTQSAIIYSLRALVEKDIPLNHGCLNPIEIIIPKGSLLDPSPAAAVVGGNVLTSQRVVDVILKAFGVVAGSQGCMNNFTFGSDKFGYYETISGGSGAGPGWVGQSAVQTHMTNTRITDPEVLELRYPVLLREFSIRQESGGDGEFRGGDGVVREVEFLEPLTIAILSERRVYPPYGLAGGDPAKVGENLLQRSSGEVIDLGGKNEIKVGVGDAIRISTPGGGGFGTPVS